MEVEVAVCNSPYGLCGQKATFEEELHEDRAFHERTEPIVNITTGATYAMKNMPRTVYMHVGVQTVNKNTA